MFQFVWVRVYVVLHFIGSLKKYCWLPFGAKIQILCHRNHKKRPFHTTVHCHCHSLVLSPSWRNVHSQCQASGKHPANNLLSFDAVLFQTVLLFCIQHHHIIISNARILHPSKVCHEIAFLLHAHQKCNHLFTFLLHHHRCMRLCVCCVRTLAKESFNGSVYESQHYHFDSVFQCT